MKENKEKLSPSEMMAEWLKSHSITTCPETRSVFEGAMKMASTYTREINEDMRKHHIQAS